MKNYQEETELYIANLGLNELGFANVNVSVGLEGQGEVKTVITKLKDKYAGEVIVQENVMYYYYVGTSESKKRANWCVESGIPVWNYDEIGEDIGDTPSRYGDKKPAPSTYKKVGTTYLNTPELSTLNPEATFYVTYDASGENETIYGRIDKVDEPTNWYNYEEQKWANIVTVSGNNICYWVWIPRYAYKTDSETETVDVRFISIENDYINSSDTTESIDGYKISDAFKFGETPLSGYWMAKYEVTIQTDEMIAVSPKSTTITVNASKADTSNSEYDVYLNGDKVYTGALPYTISKLKANTIYDVCIFKDGKPIGRETVTTKDNIEIDMSKLSIENTFYLEYDESTDSLKLGNRIDKGAPSNWYNYAKKQYANIVTAEGSTVTYWVYIPRYEYWIDSETEQIDIRFIPKEQTTPSLGYQIPDSFKFGEEDLPGYWISKYEVAEGGNTETIGVTAKIDSITVTTSGASQSGSTDNYKVFIDGKLEYTGQLPYTFTGKASGQEYSIAIAKGEELLGVEKVKTQNLEIDLTPFEKIKDRVYYVTYTGNTESTEVRTPFANGQPKDWYDYSKKQWANIVTVDQYGNEIYWVYIPRYEYALNSTAELVDVRFISKDQTTATPGYAIPDSFKFGTENLAGYWISKYEIQDGQYPEE